MDLLKYVQDKYITKKEFPEFKAGDTITVYYEIKEGQKNKNSVLQRNCYPIERNRFYKDFYNQKNEW